MHALPLLAAFVDPYAILFRRAVVPPTQVRFGDEPNPEARLIRPVGGHRWFGTSAAQPIAAYAFRDSAKGSAPSIFRA